MQMIVILRKTAKNFLRCRILPRLQKEKSFVIVGKIHNKCLNLQSLAHKAPIPIVMPVTKNPLIRHMILDRCFRSRVKLYTIADLEEVLKNAGHRVCKRTIYDDIDFIGSQEGWGMEFVNLYAEDGKTKCYRYADPHASIRRKPLTEAELEVVKDVVSTLGRFKGMPQLDWLNEVMPRLEELVYTNSETSQSPIMGFDSNDYLRGIDEHPPTLFHAIKSKTTLKIEYCTFFGKIFLWIIHPYYLKQYNNRWFLFGLNESGQISNLAIDRILTIAPTKIPYIPNDEIDFEEYFDDIVGVSLGNPEEPVEKVLIRFDTDRWPYVESKPLHHSQKNKGDNTIEISVRINNELITQILSFGSQAEVLAPLSLRQQIKEIHLAAIDKYK